MMMDPYAVLGVTRNATPDEIKSAYRKKAKQYHPDLHPNDPAAAQKFKEVSEAYQLITSGKADAYSNQQNQYGYGQQNPYGQYGQQYGQQTGQQGQYGWGPFGFGYYNYGNQQNQNRQYGYDYNQQNENRQSTGVGRRILRAVVIIAAVNMLIFLMRACMGGFWYYM